MVRFCDYIQIYRHVGDLYNPFNDNNKDTIQEILVYEGECKAKLKTNNAANNDANYIDIYINDNNINADIRDTAYLKTNNEGENIKLTIIEVKHYEKNTILYTLRVKDGENS